MNLPEQKENLLLRKESREQKHRTGQDEAGARSGPELFIPLEFTGSSITVGVDSRASG